MIHFEWVWSFIVLPLPWIVRVWMKPKSMTPQQSLHTPFIDDYLSMTSVQAVRSQTWMCWLLAIISWILLVVAVSRPQWVGDPIELPFQGRDIILAVDLSGSMREQDFILDRRWVDRLTATKVVAGEFIERREGDRLGLILFGTQAYLQTPLTFDRNTVKTLLYEAQLGLAGKNTAIGDAIGLAVKRLQKVKKQPVLILLTDGSNTAGEVGPVKAADIAAQKGIKIYTIGIGGQRSWGSIDTKTLKAVAEKTGGQFFRATDTQKLDQIYRLLDELEPIEHEGQIYRPMHALYPWPLFFSLLCAASLMIYRVRQS